CLGEDRWLALTVCDDRQWAALCGVLGATELQSDARFATAEGRRQNQDALDEAVAALTRNCEVRELTARLQQRGVAAGPVMDQRDAFEDPHLRARGMFQRRFQEDTGEVDWIGPYIRTEEGPLPIRRPPVRLAEDNEYVYK